MGISGGICMREGGGVSQLSLRCLERKLAGEDDSGRFCCGDRFSIAGTPTLIQIYASAAREGQAWQHRGEVRPRSQLIMRLLIGWMARNNGDHMKT